MKYETRNWLLLFENVGDPSTNDAEATYLGEDKDAALRCLRWRHLLTTTTTGGSIERNYYIGAYRPSKNNLSLVAYTFRPRPLNAVNTHQSWIYRMKYWMQWTLTMPKM